MILLMIFKYFYSNIFMTWHHGSTFYKGAIFFPFFPNNTFFSLYKEKTRLDLHVSQKESRDVFFTQKKTLLLILLHVSLSQMAFFPYGKTHITTRNP